MERPKDKSEGRETSEATLDVLVDAALFIAAIAALGAQPGEGSAREEDRQAVLIAAGRQLAVGDALGEPYPRGRQLPATVIRQGQICVPLSRLALLVPVLRPGRVRVCGVGQRLHVTQAAAPSAGAASRGPG